MVVGWQQRLAMRSMFGISQHLIQLLHRDVLAHRCNRRHAEFIDAAGDDAVIMRQIVIEIDGDAVPGGLRQVVLRHEPAAGAAQDQEDIELPVGQRQKLTVLQQTATPGVKSTEMIEQFVAAVRMAALEMNA